MPRITLIAGVLLLVMPRAATLSAQDWRSLFDGRSLDGWVGRPHMDFHAGSAGSPDPARLAEWEDSMRRHWRVEGEELVNDGEGVFLTTGDGFGDIELRLEYRTVPKADSGIYLRGSPQVQIWDTTEDGGKWALGARHGSGGLWNNQVHARFPSIHADRPFGQWNAVTVLQVGSRTSVSLNGSLVTDMVVMENFFRREAPLPALGPIQLQTHGGEIRWRNLQVRTIDAEESCRRLRLRDSFGFVPLARPGLFEGDLDGYSFEDGTIRCREGRSGHLFTRADYTDFDFRFEFLLPEGGNNGIAIRHPGRGNPAYDGMCEIQVLDDGDARYADIHPWQAHGSAYGLVPAHRGHLRPAGSWNFEEIHVRGSRVTVELNGSVILDADLAKVTAPPDGKEHPGRTRESGRIGFCGHGDPVVFRNVAVRVR